MIDVQDVAPKVKENIYRYEKLNSDGSGTGEYIFLKYSPGELATTPTNINRNLLMGMQGFQPKQTTYNYGGSVDEVGDTGAMHTVFNDDGSIVETFTNNDGKAISKKTTFNDDGSISETLI